MEDDPVFTKDTERKETDNIAKLVVVRHAESIANTQGIYQGQSHDTGLSPLGKKQAKELAGHLSSFRVHKVISSPLRRTFETAVEVTKAHGCELVFEERILETNHGVWEGKNKDWVNEHHGELYNLWQKAPSQAIFPGGEAFADTVERVLSFLQDHPFDMDSVIVTHDNIIRVMVALIKNMHIDEIWKIPLETASINVFEVNKINEKNVFRSLMLNEVSHLGELRNDVSSHAL